MATMVSQIAVAGHTAGIFADMSLDGPEIGTLVAVVDRAKNLPNRKTMGKQDPYCAIRLGKEAKKTNTDRRGGQTPKWDQEIRFTVHDSPDYNKMKCSIFNDDKKTDLIGEGWIDLRAVIVPGGGQNDLWHSLNYKGKYAGEVRIELTYYDTRPASEAPTGRKKSRTAQSVASDAVSTLSGPRQLGPREIKRRPLPPGPGEQTPPTEPSASLRTNQQQTTPTRPQPLAPSIPASLQPALPALPVADMSHRPPHMAQHHHAHYQSPVQQSYGQLTPQSHRYHQSSQIYPEQQHSSLPYQREEQYQPSTLPQLPRQSPQYYHAPEAHESHEYAQQAYGPLETAQQQDMHSYHAQNNEQAWSRNSSGYDHCNDERQLYQTTSHPSATPSPYSLSRPNSGSDNQHSPISPREMPLTNATQVYNSSSPARPSPPPVNTTYSQQPQRNQWNNVSPTKHIVYRDSPLRQSINHNDLPGLPLPSRDPQSFNEVAPPCPPSHRDASPRQDMAMMLANSPRGSYTSNTPSKSSLIDARSPLQSIEYQYEPRPDAPAGRPSVGQHSSSRKSFTRSNSDLPESAPPDERRSSFIGEFPAPHQLTQNYGIDIFEEPVEVDRQGRYLRRLSSNEPRENLLKGPQRSHTSESVDVFDERNTYRSEPQVVRPRAVSPNVSHSVPRKSVSPHPHSAEECLRQTGVPFGPDSYDALNPGSSPAGSPYGTPQRSRENLTKGDNQNFQNQAPIIGNDGSVIDPSDHLPSDTWAPEPERKTRKPEHIIRFRTKETRTQSGPASSPVTYKPLSATNSPRPTVQHQTSAPASPYQELPRLPLTPGSGGTRNRLQKQLPVRPLPTQPYPHAQTSPAAISQPSSHEGMSSSPQRPLMQPSPMSGMPQRAPLSEYQVPATNSYSPRGSYYAQQLPPTPTRMPVQRPQSYTCGGPDSSLAAEMSMIDIGPSRGGGRTAQRQQRGYDGY